MPRFLLDRLRVASPCSADWDGMRGDDRVRVCDACALHVHDLSAMTDDEAEAFLDQHTVGTEGRVCIRLWRRADGRVLTQDCPVGVRDAARRAWRRRIGKGAVVASLASLWTASTYVADQAWTWLRPGTEPRHVLPPDDVIMGEMVPAEEWPLPPEIDG